MKHTLFAAMAVLLMAGMTAEAKNEKAQGKSGKARKEMKQDKAEADKGAEKAEEAKAKSKGKSEEAKKKGKSGEEKAKGKSEEMKKATAEKKDAQNAARESGEKLDKEQKSWWKFWK